MDLTGVLAWMILGGIALVILTIVVIMIVFLLPLLAGMVVMLLTLLYYIAMFPIFIVRHALIFLKFGIALLPLAGIWYLIQYPPNIRLPIITMPSIEVIPRGFRVPDPTLPNISIPSIDPQVGVPLIVGVVAIILIYGVLTSVFPRRHATRTPVTVEQVPEPAPEQPPAIPDREGDDLIDIEDEEEISPGRVVPDLGTEHLSND